MFANEINHIPDELPFQTLKQFSTVFLRCSDGVDSQGRAEKVVGRVAELPQATHLRSIELVGSRDAPALRENA